MHLFPPNPAFWLPYLSCDFPILYTEGQHAQVALGDDANHVDHPGATGVQQLVLSALTARQEQA